MMTPRENVESALLGRWADRVPFTAYFNKFSASQVERELRNNGLCIIEFYNRVYPYMVDTPHISEKTISYRGEDGITRIRRVVETPRGTISMVDKVLADYPRIPGQFVPWHEEYFFKAPEDYKPIVAMIRDRLYSQNYEAFCKARDEAGGDVFMFPDIGYSPLQELIIQIMGLEQFSLEWHCRRDELIKLYEVLIEDRRKLYPILSESPILVAGYGGNVSPEVVGLARFEKYILPHYNELAEMLHESGKMLSVHFDANTRVFASAIAKSEIDIIEAFTPSPDCDMSVAEAREAWPDKVLWINFPSAVHLQEPSLIEETTRQILREAAPGNRFLFGITETVPVNKWQQSFSAISRVINAEGRLPL
jgi:hypothetical protein